MKHFSISRKDFIRDSAIGLAGLALTPGLLYAQSGKNAEDKTIKPTNAYTLKNVSLEIGFEYEGDEVIATKTDLFLIEIDNGKIKRISPNKPGANAIDAKGMLMLPSFKDMHIHLDKTFYGGKWQAVKRRSGGVKGMIELEQQILPELLKTSTFKAEKMIELLQSK